MVVTANMQTCQNRLDFVVRRNPVAFLSFLNIAVLNEHKRLWLFTDKLEGDGIKVKLVANISKGTMAV